MSHLNLISKTLDLFSNKYEQVLPIGDFDIEKCGNPKDHFCNIYNLLKPK